MTSPPDAHAKITPGFARLGAYGLLRMPLALLELPLFVLLPNYYSSTLGVELTIVGTVLFVARLIDAILDPALGGLIDGTENQRWAYRTWIWLALPIIAVGFVALVNPPSDLFSPGFWLAITSAITYVGYSLASIAYQAWGAEIGTTDRDRARVTGVREGFGLVGVLIAASWLTPEGVPTLTILFIVMAAAAAFALTLAPSPMRRGSRDTVSTAAGTNVAGRENPAAAADRQADRSAVQSSVSPPVPSTASSPPEAPVRFSLTAPWEVVRTNTRFRWLLIVFLFNGIATAIPATLVLFFINDVLQASDRAPMFLGIYFLSGALGMPLWIWLVGRVSLRKAWLAGMGFSVIAFVWALALGSGDVAGYAAVCALTGLALGADLAMPPALLASLLAGGDEAGRREGAYFGVWNFTTKFNLAAAAGLGLPLLSLGGYVPGVAIAPGDMTLPLVYAGLPCVLKLISAGLLWTAPITERHDRAATLTGTP